MAYDISISESGGSHTGTRHPAREKPEDTSTLAGILASRRYAEFVRAANAIVAPLRNLGMTPGVMDSDGEFIAFNPDAFAGYKPKVQHA